MVARLKMSAKDLDPKIYFGSAGLPVPVKEFRFHPQRKWRFDFCWAHPALRFALEVEGAVWTHGRHTRGSGFVKDIEKYNEAALLGWSVLRCTPKELNNGQAIELVRRMIEAKQKWNNPRAV